MPELHVDGRHPGHLGQDLPGPQAGPVHLLLVLQRAVQQTRVLKVSVISCIPQGCVRKSVGEVAQLHVQGGDKCGGE